MWDTIVGTSLIVASVGTLVALPICLKIQEIKERRTK